MLGNTELEYRESSHQVLLCSFSKKKTAVVVKIRQNLISNLEKTY